MKFEDRSPMAVADRLDKLYEIVDHLINTCTNQQATIDLLIERTVWLKNAQHTNGGDDE